MKVVNTICPITISCDKFDTVTLCWSNLKEEKYYIKHNDGADYSLRAWKLYSKKENAGIIVGAQYFPDNIYHGRNALMVWTLIVAPAPIDGTIDKFLQMPNWEIKLEQGNNDYSFKITVNAPYHAHITPLFDDDQNDYED